MTDVRGSKGDLSLRKSLQMGPWWVGWVGWGWGGLEWAAQSVLDGVEWMVKGKWLDVGILRIGAGLAGGYPPLALATLRQDQPCSAKKQALYISTFSSETGTLLGKDSMFHFKILCYV